KRQGVRRAAGKQAEILNKIIFSGDSTVKVEERLKELIGHTPIEVVVGALLGIVLGYFLS
ncbi:MAG: divergent PAP2 family protein, partial [Clostridiaceae bacterium]|nr:divergent PAP2 family protein [Clostridiaceae bacterium]